MDSSQYIENLVTSIPWGLAEVIERGWVQPTVEFCALLCMIMKSYVCVFFALKTFPEKKNDRSFVAHLTISI
jgi:hypothetical protein